MKTLYIKQFNEVCNNFINDINLVTENASSTEVASVKFIQGLGNLSRTFGTKFNEMNFSAVATLLINYTLSSTCVDEGAIALPAIRGFVNDIKRNYASIDDDFAYTTNMLVENIENIANELFM